MFPLGLLCQEPLSVDGIMRHVLIRGMVRIRCRLEVGRILAFLTRHAYVNCGFLKSPLPELPRIAVARLPKQPDYPRWTSANDEPPSVIVIGAGPSGLSAAFHLRCLGVKVRTDLCMANFGCRTKRHCLMCILLCQQHSQYLAMLLR